MNAFGYSICHLRLSEAGEAGEASPRPRLGGKMYWHRNKARLTGTRNYIILLLESQQGSTPNEFRTLLPCQNFRPQLAQRDGLKAGFESFKAWIVVKRKCLKMKPGWKQASKQLEASFEAGPGGLGYRNSKNGRNKGPVF